MNIEFDVNGEIIAEVISIEQMNEHYDPWMACNGGGYDQPEYKIRMADGTLAVLRDTSCGDFGGRFFFQYGDRCALWGSMLSEEQAYSDYTEADRSFLDVIGRLTGYDVPTNGDWRIEP